MQKYRTLITLSVSVYADWKANTMHVVINYSLVKNISTYNNGKSTWQTEQCCWTVSTLTSLAH